MKNKIINTEEFKKLLKEILEKMENLEVNNKKIIEKLDTNKFEIYFNNTVDTTEFTKNGNLSEFVTDFINSGLPSHIKEMYPEKDVQRIPAFMCNENNGVVKIDILAI